jgi:3-dehydrotetronate 4-kinase
VLNHPLLLGCIADDFTGATDLANNLVRSGMRVLQINGLPAQAPAADAFAHIDAVVIALKSRTVAAEDAVAQSLKALAWLRERDAKQIYFKYCSTFDSTPQGNIGSVLEALMDATGAEFSIATPAFPDNGRSVFKGHLFVGDQLLHESGMQNHPLTPMTDANLVRVLQAQCHRKVGLIDYRTVMRGPQAVSQHIQLLRSQGVSIAVVDAISNDDLMVLGKAIGGLELISGGSGVAIGLAQNHGLKPSSIAAALPAATGHLAVVSGSCSLATNRQVAHFLAAGHGAFLVDPQCLAQGDDVVNQALAWAQPRLGGSPILIYSTAQPQSLQAVQGELGAAAAGAMVEDALARIAQGLVRLGVGQLVVAGGETSGACVQALGVVQMQIGSQIDPGVPWCHAKSTLGEQAGPNGLHLALKSGNFGTDDFFTKAFTLLATS